MSQSSPPEIENLWRNLNLLLSQVNIEEPIIFIADPRPLSFYSNFLLNWQWFVHSYLLKPTSWSYYIFRAIFNGLMRNAIFLTEYFPYLAYYKFGFKNSHVNIYKQHME